MNNYIFVLNLFNHTMYKPRVFPILTLIFLLSAFCLQAQTEKNTSVFFIGDQQDFYHEITANYSASLLDVCNNSMTQSYEIWSNTMKDIESYCMDQGFDIKGTKLWINLFWDKDGKLDNIVFHEKPNSILLDYEKLRTLLSQYIKVAQKGLPYKARYSHYGTISFPVFYYSQRAQEK